MVIDVLEWLGRPDDIDQDHEQGGSIGIYDIGQYLPGDHGSVLITTRLSRLAEFGDSKRLNKVDQKLGNAMFRQWYRQ